MDNYCFGNKALRCTTTREQKKCFCCTKVQWQYSTVITWYLNAWHYTDDNINRTCNLHAPQQGPVSAMVLPQPKTWYWYHVRYM